VLIQHGSNKKPNQRLLCLDKELGDAAATGATCGHSFMMIIDLGKTFGRANTFNKDAVESVNFKEWSAMTIWKEGAPSCVGNVPGSFTGTLHNPGISGARTKVSRRSARPAHGRAAARHLRRRALPAARSECHVNDWVNAFKQKRAEIVNRACAS
jgi:hypothetical protein